MMITPITPIASVASVASANSIEPLFRIGRNASVNHNQHETGKTGFSFSDILKQMIDNVNATNAQTQTDSFNLAMGFTDLEDLHNIEINAMKADLALRTMTSVRNKVLEAYTEIMRITV